MNALNGPQQAVTLDWEIDLCSLSVSLTFFDKILKLKCYCESGKSHALPGEQAFSSWISSLRKFRKRLFLDFLDCHKSDPLFSRLELSLNSTHSVPFYENQFAFDSKAVFWVVALETVQLSAGQGKFLTAHFPNWRSLLFQLVNAVNESLQKIQANQDVSTPHMFFGLSEDEIGNVFNKMTRPDITIYENTTLGSPEVVPDNYFNKNSQTWGNENTTRKQKIPISAKANKESGITTCKR